MHILIGIWHSFALETLSFGFHHTYIPGFYSTSLLLLLNFLMGFLLCHLYGPFSTLHFLTTRFLLSLCLQKFWNVYVSLARIFPLDSKVEYPCVFLISSFWCLMNILNISKLNRWCYPPNLLHFQCLPSCQMTSPSTELLILEIWGVIFDYLFANMYSVNKFHCFYIQMIF